MTNTTTATESLPTAVTSALAALGAAYGRGPVTAEEGRAALAKAGMTSKGLLDDAMAAVGALHQPQTSREETAHEAAMDAIDAARRAARKAAKG